jgi:hypothetical protein
LPIKTYIDYKLQDNPKEEFEINPLVPVLEFLSSVKPGENIYIQIVIRAHKKEKRKGFFIKATDWSTEVMELRAKFVEAARAEGRPVFAEEEAKIINALNRAVQKFPFDTGIRILYIADKDIYTNTTVTGLRGILRPFSSAFGESLDKIDLKKTREDRERDLQNDPSKRPHYAAFNGFTFGGRSTDFDYPWEDFYDVRMNYKRRKFIDAFKRRMFFYPPYHEPTNVLTTEALATLWHFPGSVAAVPGLQRIESKRGQAPANLPV